MLKKSFVVDIIGNYCCLCTDLSLSKKKQSSSLSNKNPTSQFKKRKTWKKKDFKKNQSYAMKQKKADFPPSENSCEAAEINMKKQLLFNSTSFPTTIWYICIIT